MNIQRRKPLKRFRSKPRRRNRETPEHVRAVRQAVYERSGGKCELNLREDCIKGVLPWAGVTPWDHWHLVHKKSIGSGGKTTPENCVGGCWRCHLIGDHVEGGNGKIVSAKQPKTPQGRIWYKENENYS